MEDRVKKFSRDSELTEEQKIIIEAVDKLHGVMRKLLNKNKDVFNDQELFIMMRTVSMGFCADILNYLCNLLSDKDQILFFTSETRLIFNNYLLNIENKHITKN